MTKIQKLSNRYIWQGLLVGLVLMALAYSAVSVDAPKQLSDTISVATYIGFCFFMLVTMAEAVVWRRVAEGSPESLPTFFTAVSGGRMLLALTTMFVYYLVKGREAMLPFFIVFVVFYVVQLVHHSIFFSRVSNHLDELNNK